MKQIFISLCLCFSFAACQQNKNTNENPDILYQGDTIIIHENSPVLTQMSVQKVSLKDYSSEFKTVGTVPPVSGKFAEIAAPFAGRITKSFVQLGQNVNSGTPIFELSSSDFYEASKAYFAAQSANDLAQKNYLRQKELAANGIASQKDLETARNEANIAEQEYEQAKATLQIFNIDETTLQMGQTLKVVSPISGEIVKCNITIGDYVQEDTEPQAVVADLSHVWISALVKEKYFGAIKNGDRVEIYTDAHPDKIIWGTIHYIGEMLDEETRSLEVIVECDNTNRELKLGMFCETHFLSSPTQAIILPATAIMQEEDNDYVLIEISEGRYIRRKVKTETINTAEVRITEGITEGENVVTKGGIFLNM